MAPSLSQSKKLPGRPKKKRSEKEMNMKEPRVISLPYSNGSGHRIIRMND